jgi:putative transposase
MIRKRHTEEQIIALLKDAQAGVSVQDLCRKHGISDTTFYTRRTKYAGLEVSDVKKLRLLEDENRRLQQMVAEQALDDQALRGRMREIAETMRRYGCRRIYVRLRWEGSLSMV